MIRTAQRAATAAALTMTAALALSACGGSGDPDAGSTGTGSSQSTSAANDAAVYQFDNARVSGDKDEEPFVTTKNRVVVKLSDELKAAVPDGSRVAIDKLTLTPKAFSTGICRLDIAIDYAGGGEKAVSTSDDGAKPASAVASNITGYGLDLHSGDKIVDEVPSNDQVEKDSTYVTSDLKHITRVTECSTDADTDYLTELDFPYAQHSGDRDDFASVKIGVMSGGGQSGGSGTTTSILGSTAADLSVDGKWKQPAAS